MLFILLFVILLFVIIAVLDRSQKAHTIISNFPIFGRLRYFAEKLGPPIRQYFISNNREELPFNRSQRSWIYSSSKGVNNYEGFGTDKNIYEANFILQCRVC